MNRAIVAVCGLRTAKHERTPCAGDKTGQYKGVLDCFAKSYKQGGLLTFYNGFLPNFARLGSWNCAMFLTVEQASILLAGLAAQ